MQKSNRRHITLLCVLALCIAVFIALLLWPKPSKDKGSAVAYTDILRDTVAKIASAYPGEIGVAVIINGSDTLTVNNQPVYPMMSVFKVHQALAICMDLDTKGLPHDTVLSVSRNSLDPCIWSPMLKDHSEPKISLSVKELLRYTLIQSDNNASNLMFERLLNVARTDSIVAALIPRCSFKLLYTEAEMKKDHARAYANRTSPLGAAILMERLFTDSLVSCGKQGFLQNTLQACATGKDRIAAPLLGVEGVSIAHKTGSGFRDAHGTLAAHNDVAYICLPNKVCYTLAVFVKDFKGDEAQASEAIAHISAAIYEYLSQQPHI